MQLEPYLGPTYVFLPSFVLDAMLQRYISATLVEDFERHRHDFKENVNCIRRKQLYKAAKQRIQPHLGSAKEKILKLIRHKEIENIRRVGFIQANEGDNEGGISSLMTDLKVVEMYMQT